MRESEKEAAAAEVLSSLIPIDIKLFIPNDSSFGKRKAMTLDASSAAELCDPSHPHFALFRAAHERCFARNASSRRLGIQLEEIVPNGQRKASGKVCRQSS